MRLIALVLLAASFGGWQISTGSMNRLFREDTLAPPSKAEDYKELFNEAMDQCSASLWMRRMLAAQVQQESYWDRWAVSSANAKGLGQFTSSGQAEAERLEPGLKNGDPFDPRWAFLAQCITMRHQISLWHEREKLPLVVAVRAAFASYNAGRSSIRKEWLACRRVEGCNPSLYFGHISRICLRNPESCIESRDYVRYIEKHNVRYDRWF